MEFSKASSTASIEGARGGAATAARGGGRGKNRVELAFGSVRDVRSLRLDRGWSGKE